MANLINLTNKEREYLNLNEKSGKYYRNNISVIYDIPPDFYVYIVAKWCRRVNWNEEDLTPKSYCNFAEKLEGYKYPIFEK